MKKEPKINKELDLADRMSNISRMETWDKKRQQHYLKKTKFWKDGNELKTKMIHVPTNQVGIVIKTYKVTGRGYNTQILLSDGSIFYAPSREFTSLHEDK